ncbi:YiiX/YebB-like N1pC/P60 family cysteine hydrolase [Sporosarcina koreensis]|uniref:YiiX/YebB-like N1pC/P60 family cysteine hydrolase n=1 Tax=Sporosarcina koreensis TaxID=334735 RepID=A0ABW0TZQ3_9BACL
MKRFIAMALAGILVIGVQSPFRASAVQQHKDVMVTIQPNASVEEPVLSSRLHEKQTKEMVKQNQLSIEMTKLLAEHFGKSVKTQGGGSANYIIGPSDTGDFFYTPASTAFVNHGHVGLYYSSNTIVESIFPTGVRSISANVKMVEKGAVVKSVSTTEAVKQNAANWAYTQIGQPYSLNFMNNRRTGHLGAKNCSKLIWSAYFLHGGLDLDVNKGFGVYPRDIRDAKQTRFVRQI